MRESPYPMVPVDQALAAVLKQVAPLPAVPVPLVKALGLVMAEAVRAPVDLPPFDAAVVDGFALRAADGLGPRRLIGEQMAGHVSGLQVAAGCAARITTGAPMPPGADAVVKVEEADEANGTVIPHRPLRPGTGIRPAGADVRAGEPVLAAGASLGPAELGVLASLGQGTALVHRRPVVGVFSTGDELVEPGQAPGPGQIHDSNRTSLLAAVAWAGGDPVDLGILRDRPGELTRALAAALVRNDLLITSGGVSMGELDLLKPLLARWGQIHFGRVLMKPGKPLTFATVAAPTPEGDRDAGQASRPVFALPGNPVSSLVTFHLFVRPAIRRMLGYRSVSLPRLTATLGHDFLLDPERPEFHRVNLRRAGEAFVAESTGSQASSRLLSASGADGLLCLEQAAGVAPAGSRRPVLLLDDAWLT